MLQKFVGGTANPLLLLDQLFGALIAYLTFTIDLTQSLGFELVIRGGKYAANVYADFALTMAASTTYYIEADTVAHTIVSNTSAYTGGTNIAIGIAVTNTVGRLSWAQDFNVAS